MAKQSFIWTALPNGRTPDGTSLRLSVMLSPRLDPQGDPQQLDTFFPDWEDWPQTLSNARFDVTFNGQTVSIPATQIAGPNRVDTRVGTADSAVWKALFTAALGVRRFEYKDLSSASVLSYDAGVLTDLIEKLYRDLARRATDQLPGISSFIDVDGWRDLLSDVAELDEASYDHNTFLRNPRHQFAGLAAGNPAAITATIPETLARFQLFHTPPASPIVRHEARTDDARIEARWLEYQRSELPKKADLAKRLDFHDVVAAMGSYPTLLRRLGLVVDLILSPGSFLPAASANLSVKAVFAPGTLDITQTADAGPATLTRLTSQRFDAVPNPGADFHVKDGLLDLDAGSFRLLQVDIDSAGLKVMNVARTMNRRFVGDARVDSVTRHEDEMGAPSLRTAGLMLVQQSRAAALKNRFSVNKTRNANLEGQFAGAANSVSLHAEDVVRGYRVDIWDSATGRWRSLCRRTARYELMDGLVVVDVVPEEESTVRLAATKSTDPTSNPDLLFLHESLVTWTGWSLAAPPPGRAISPDDSVDTTTVQSEAEPPPGLKFKSTFAAVKYSLPRLRFGRAYWMRLRAVDLAGNSLDPRDGDFGTEQPTVRSQMFRRYEPVAPPVIALLSTSGAIEKPAEGESMARIAIRSFNDTPAGNAVPTSQIAHRVAAPPRVSARDAEYHGSLDTAGKLDSALFAMLANQKDVDPRNPSAAIREVKIPLKGPLDETAVDTTFAVYESGRVLTYLPDPLAVEVSARVFDHPNIADTEIITIPLYTDDVWPEAQPFTIEVYDDPLAIPYFDAPARRLRVPLPKGVRSTVRLSMALSPDTLDLMAIMALLQPADRDAQRTLAETGQHWMLTPWTNVEVVHATQRPLLTPEFTVLLVHDRNPADTSARPLIFAQCSIKSTDRLDLLGEWHEPLDDPDAPAGPGDRVRRDVAFQVRVTDPKSYGGSPEHTINGPDLIAINASSDATLPTKAHEFHDTRYRRVEYWLDATSRFREFLPGSLLRKTEGTELVPIEDNIKVTGARRAAWIPSASPPPMPKVLYVLPTFGWTRKVDDDGTLSSWRSGGGLRVYLDRGWNATGYGEMLGVLLPPVGFTGDPESMPAGYPYKKYVTQWGNDPIWDSAFVRGLGPRLSDFPRARTQPDPTGAWLPPGAPPTEKDQRPGPFAVKGLFLSGLGAGSGSVDVAPHDVFYDDSRRLWYCDIEVSAGAAYSPFIRLALARYQPTSSTGAHLSNVVLADIIALTADRWLNVTPVADARQVRVSVFGVTYDESSAHDEASHSVALSLFNPLTNQVETLVPANVARSTVVEISVERLDPRFGEDFGWQRVSDAIISPRIPAPAPGPAHPVSGAQQTITQTAAGSQDLRTQPLLTARDLTRLSAERLTDMITEWKTLWEGDVALPEPDPASPRQRLVIAEYEEHLVDDSRPYDKTPTRKDRRLVFIEYVELEQ